MLTHFKSVKIEHILRNSNSRVDVLSKLALGKMKGKYDTFIQIMLSQPSVSIVECMSAKSVGAKPNVEPVKVGWRKVILEVIRSIGKGEQVQDKTLVNGAAGYVLIGEDLYKKGFLDPSFEVS